MSMNLDRRVKAQTDLFCPLANDEDQKGRGDPRIL